MKIFHEITVDIDRRIKSNFPDLICKKASRRRRQRLYDADYYERKGKYREICRLTRVESEKLEELSRKYGFKRAVILKKAAFAYINEGAVISKHLASQIQETNFHLRKIGTNINQIAAKTNALGKITDAFYLRAALKRLQKVETSLESFISSAF